MARKPKAAASAAAKPTSPAVTPEVPSEGATQAAGGETGGPTGGEEASPPAGSDATLGETPVPTPSTEPVYVTIPASSVAVEAAVANEAASEPAAAGPIGPHLVVRGPRKGRRRAGRAFGAEPVTIPLAELGTGVDGLSAMVALLTDPALQVICYRPDGEELVLDDDDVAELARQLEIERTASAQRVGGADVSDIVAELLGDDGQA